MDVTTLGVLLTETIIILLTISPWNALKMFKSRVRQI